MEYHYETFNRLPVYYGGDLYDTEDMDEFDPDVQEGMDFLTYTHSRPDGGETQGRRYGRYGLYVSDCVRGQTWGSGRARQIIRKRTLLILRN